MNFEYNQEQRMLADSLQRYFSQPAAPSQMAPTGSAQWQQISELGAPAMLFDEQCGGLGGSAFDVMLVFETVGQALLRLPLLSTLLCGSALARAGSPLQQDYLAVLLAGQAQAAWAHQEADGHYEDWQVACRAQAHAEGWRLDGVKVLVQHAESADSFIVSARTAGAANEREGISLFVVPRTALGLTLQHGAQIEGGTLSRLQFDHLILPLTALLGRTGGAAEILDYCTGRALLALCAEALGAMTAAKQATLLYLQTRTQFGVLIGSFQALQHRMVDLYIEIEQARSAVINAAASFAADGYADARALSAAKFTIGRVAKQVAEECIQLHGGMGMSWELPLAHYAKRLIMIDHQFGDEDHHLQRYMALSAAADAIKLKSESSMDLFISSQDSAAAAAHAADAALQATQIAGVTAATPVRNIALVAVIGAGTMGSGIAMNFLNAGIPVLLLEMQAEALARGRATILKTYDAALARGKLSTAERDARMALLTTTLAYEEIAAADLVIEAVFEDLTVKQQVFVQLDSVMKPGAILASNTSTLDMNQIAAFTMRPQDVLGLHFFSPAHVMRLLEVVRTAQTAPEVLASVMLLAQKINKVAVVSGVCDGFIGNRMLRFYREQALARVEQGATPQQVDLALERWGMAMGPFRMADLAGLDIGWAVRKRQYAADPSMHRSVIADRLCEAGRFGQKSGAGWYAYAPGERSALPDAAVTALIEQVRAEHGLTTRPVSDEEIVERCMFALVNEGARIVEEGIAARCSDVDLVYLAGYGFPAHRGGPLFWAEQIGWATVLAKLKEFAAVGAADARFWQPAALLVRLAQAGSV